MALSVVPQRQLLRRDSDAAWANKQYDRRARLGTWKSERERTHLFSSQTQAEQHVACGAQVTGRDSNRVWPLVGATEPSW